MDSNQTTWYFVWLKEWSPVILGAAQVATAIVLAWLTNKLSKSTSEYSHQVKLQTDIMNKNINLSRDAIRLTEINKKRETLIKEMDCLVGPLYSKLENPEFFNKTKIREMFSNTGQHEYLKKIYDTCAFWQTIKQNKYLASKDSWGVDHWNALDSYLKIKFDSISYADTAYAEHEKDVRLAIEARYQKIETELLELK